MIRPAIWGAVIAGGIAVLQSTILRFVAIAGVQPDLVLILVIFVGGQMMGLFGMLLAVPIFSTILILFKEFILPQIRQLADEAPDS